MSMRIPSNGTFEVSGDGSVYGNDVTEKVRRWMFSWLSNWDSEIIGAVLGSIVSLAEAVSTCFWILLELRRVEETRRRRWVNSWT